MKERPLFFVGLTGLAAQFIGLAVPPAAIWLPAAFCICLAACLCWAKRWFTFAAALFCGIVLLGQACFVNFRQLPAARLNGVRTEITGEVRSVSPGFTGQSRRVRVHITESSDKRAEGLTAELVVWDVCEAGDVLRADVEFKALKENAFTASKLADGVLLEGEAAEIHFAGFGSGAFARLARLRARLADAVQRYLKPELGGVAAAMTVGERGGLDAGVKERFRRAGLSHLLVVSGLHMSAWSALCLAVCAVFNKKNRWRYLPVLLGMICFAAMVGFTPSVSRALVAGIIFCLCGMSFREPDGLTSLGAALVVLLPFSPYACRDAGFLLSVFATMGVLCSGLAVRRLRLAKMEIYDEPMAWWQKWTLKAVRLAAVPFFAALFTLPVLIWMGNGISVVSVAANLAAGAFVPVQLALGWLCAAAGILLPGGALHHVASLLMGLCLRLLCGIAGWFAALPFGVAQVYGTYPLLVVLVLFALGFAAWRLKLTRLMWAAAPVCLAFAFWLHAALNAGCVTVAMIGNANSPCGVMMQNGNAVVIFRGGMSNAEAVAEYLDKHGSEAQVVIDLRGQAAKREGLPKAQTVIFAQETGPLGTKCAVPGTDMTAAVLRQKESSLALVEVGGYTIAAAAGGGDWTGTPEVGLLLAGQSRPKGLEYCNVLAFSQGANWLTEEETAWQGPMPTVLLRPGQALRFERNWP